MIDYLNLNFFNLERFQLKFFFQSLSILGYLKINQCYFCLASQRLVLIRELSPAAISSALILNFIKI